MYPSEFYSLSNQTNSNHIFKEDRNPINDLRFKYLSPLAEHDSLDILVENLKQRFLNFNKQQEIDSRISSYQQTYIHNHHFNHQSTQNSFALENVSHPQTHLLSQQTMNVTPSTNFQSYFSNSDNLIDHYLKFLTPFFSSLIRNPTSNQRKDFEEMLSGFIHSYGNNQNQIENLCIYYYLLSQNDLIFTHNWCQPITINHMGLKNVKFSHNDFIQIMWKIHGDLEKEINKKFLIHILSHIALKDIDLNCNSFKQNIHLDFWYKLAITCSSILISKNTFLNQEVKENLINLIYSCSQKYIYELNEISLQCYIKELQDQERSRGLKNSTSNKLKVKATNKLIELFDILLESWDLNPKQKQEMLNYKESLIKFRERPGAII